MCRCHLLAGIRMSHRIPQLHALYPEIQGISCSRAREILQLENSTNSRVRMYLNHGCVHACRVDRASHVSQPLTFTASVRRQSHRTDERLVQQVADSARFMARLDPNKIPSARYTNLLRPYKGFILFCGSFAHQRPSALPWRTLLTHTREWLISLVPDGVYCPK